MNRFWQLLLTAIETLGFIVGLAIVKPPLALAPPTEITAFGLESLNSIQSLEELKQLRDRLLSKTETITQSDEPIKDELRQTVQALEIKIHLEQQARENLAAAMSLATQAVDRTKDEQPSLDLLQDAESLWLQAIAQLEKIPQQTLLSPIAEQKIAQYKKHYQSIAYQVDVAQSYFLKLIATRMGNPDRVSITVCQVSDGDCRYWRGDTYPASAASLIKVPIAIALMEKVTSENISLDTKIKVSRGNYTEDPEGANIWSGREHTLRELLLRTIDRSSNIATNQLIDYLGRDYINQVLRDRGYTFTLVDRKLVGNRIYPSNAGGSQINRIVTRELTDMMVKIYNQEHPGDNVLLDALVRQSDRELGYQALSDSSEQWIGEKTGKNSKVLGTTVGVLIRKAYKERYVITITHDYNSNPQTIRQGIRDIVDHIALQGHL
ncbi:serine hydrolase [Pleurocapsales cyanobacterium LEGE 06147]|nr:serine hydrolase [Pleurocapsales cyanobacterium LEGE 06147]